MTVRPIGFFNLSGVDPDQLDAKLEEIMAALDEREELTLSDESAMLKGMTQAQIAKHPSPDGSPIHSTGTPQTAHAGGGGGLDFGEVKSRYEAQEKLPQGERKIWVHQQGVENFQKKVDRLNSRARRYFPNQDPFAVAKTGRVAKATEVYWDVEGGIDFEGPVPPGARVKRQRGHVWYEYDIKGEPPVVPGFEFVGTIEHIQEEGGEYTNILKKVPGFEDLDLSKYRDAGPNCDLCKRNIYRRDTFLVRNAETGEIKQLGRDDLQNYTGATNAEDMAKYAAMWTEFQTAAQGDDFMGGEGGGEWGIPQDTFLTHAAMIVRQDGRYIKTSEPGRSTRDTVMTMYTRNGPARLKEMGYDITPTDQDEKKANDVMAWLDEMDPEAIDSDYIWNLYAAARHPSGVLSKNSGLMASAIAAYDREQGLIVQRQTRTNQDSLSEWVGEIKERRDFELTVTRENSFEGAYGTTFVYEFADDDANQFVWFASNPMSDKGRFVEVGDKLKLKATIKDHKLDTYGGRERKQTILTRGSVLEVFTNQPDTYYGFVTRREEKGGRYRVGWVPAAAGSEQFEFFDTLEDAEAFEAKVIDPERVEKHDGPGAHSGTGSPQTVHDPGVAGSGTVVRGTGNATYGVQPSPESRQSVPASARRQAIMAISRIEDRGRPVASPEQVGLWWDEVIVGGKEPRGTDVLINELVANDPELAALIEGMAPGIDQTAITAQADLLDMNAQLLSEVTVNPRPGIDDNPAIVAQATQMFEQALANESSVSPVLQSVAAETGGELAGFQHRVKFEAAIRDKLARDMAAEIAAENNPSWTEVASKIHDLNRYTVTWPADENWAANHQATIDALAAEGWEVYDHKNKNGWSTGDHYNGMNYQFKKGDQFMEVQFHTPESHYIKEQSHQLYSQARLLPNDDPERQNMLNRIWDLWNSDPSHVPPGVDALGTPTTFLMKAQVVSNPAYLFYFRTDDEGVPTILFRTDGNTCEAFGNRTGQWHPVPQTLAEIAGMGGSADYWPTTDRAAMDYIMDKAGAKPDIRAKKRPAKPGEAKRSVRKRILKADFSPTIKIVDSDEPQNLIFGWANVSFTKDGEQVLDHQGHMIDIEDLEHMAYNFTVKYRKSGDMHRSEAFGELVESMVYTPEKLEVLGLAPGSLPYAWWVGFRLPPDEAEKVRNGERSMLSIEGGARLELVEE